MSKFNCIKNIKLLLVLAVFCVGLVFQVGLVKALDTGLETTVGAATKSGAALKANQEIDVKVGSLLGTILSYVGVLFFILIVYGGLMWMTAAGNDQKVAKAKELIINATIGLIVVLSAYAITNFIGTAASK